MRLINNKFDLALASGRALSVLAVFMLVVIGGTYAHANEATHHHQLVEGSVSSVLTKHTHINDAGSIVDDSSDIHCGGEILFPPKPLGIDSVFQISKLVNLADQRLTSLSKGLDPPPPRLFSKVI